MKNSFENRHIGISSEHESRMLNVVGVKSMSDLIDTTIPENIRTRRSLDIPEALSEIDYLKHIKKISSNNVLKQNHIGQGYYGTIVPSVILRNVFENPGWYTQYTPYQAEISQGRLEALLNFQTMVSDLTGLPMANASLLDEGTAAAEAMTMSYEIINKRIKKDKKNHFIVSDGVFKQTLDVVLGRALPLDIEVESQNLNKIKFSDNTFGILLQYPNQFGEITDYQELIREAKESGVMVIMAADLLALCLLKSPGEMGADIAVGSCQRLGVPMGCGGPHAAYFATEEKYKRSIPGRIIGVSIDRNEKPALRMALQTREQHIKRERATSNICTAQALLAIMSSMYAVYHGPDGFKGIATEIALKTSILHNHLSQNGFSVSNEFCFDTVTIEGSQDQRMKIKTFADRMGINLFYRRDSISISIDETTSDDDLDKLLSIFGDKSEGFGKLNLHPSLARMSTFMTHPVFNSYHTETEMMRYIKRLENRDLSLVHSMIPLGSCTMKLNAATQLIPLGWAEFADIHPFAPSNQMKGYHQIFSELSEYLCKITGFAACSLQPNSGAQGELAGLLVITAYHRSRNESHRNITLIPQSAHGTNPASAVMAGTKVVVVNCDEQGNIDVEDLKKKCDLHKDNLAGLMVTYPSTHGVFEESITEICNYVHLSGGLVYMDGANMNAQVGLTNPASIGADVCHLNLHKTFSIPHGGGGPGMGPICVEEKLVKFLPGHGVIENEVEAIFPIASAPWGSASILLISYAYIRLLGKDGVTNATKYAILSANYVKSKLANDYQVLYLSSGGMCAHELIIDLRPFKSIVSAEDVSKRLIDYGFHAPTVSFPVPGTVMIEPTESESLTELDRFIQAMLQIRKEIDEIAHNKELIENNVLTNAPHTIQEISSDVWNHAYSRAQAAFPVNGLMEQYKFWPHVSRVNNGYGDRNLMCICPPVSDYMDSELEVV